jgi:hypothetical protein
MNDLNFKIDFYQYGHNGDAITAKEFIRQVITEYPMFDYTLYHTVDTKVLQDLNIKFVPLVDQFDLSKKSYRSKNYLAISIGCSTYSPPYYDLIFKDNQPPYYFYRGIHLNMLRQMWSDIFDIINKHCSTNLKLKEAVHYLPTIDYDQFDVEKIDKFISIDSNKKILLCNGPTLTGQSFAEDFSDILPDICNLHPDKTFICTKSFNTNIPNLKFTNDIIGIQGSDLNEIGYLSRYCDLIIGKHSGPFMFTLTKENLLDSGKTFLSFVRPINDSFPIGADINAQYIISELNDQQCDSTRYNPARIKDIIIRCLNYI